MTGKLQTMQLTKSEAQIILDLRAEQAHADQQEAFREKALVVANDFQKWLKKEGYGASFSTFVNSFGYDRKDCQMMYAAVEKILDVVRKLEIPKKEKPQC